MLAFDEATHTYTFGGRRVSSVTEILKPLNDYSAIPAAVLAVAADRGTRAHLATELDDAGTLDESTVADDIKPYLQAWRTFKSERSPVILDIELRVHNPTSNYAGTLDRLLSMDGDDWLIDIKTGAEIPGSVGPQTAAYKAATGNDKLRRGVVQLKGDGTYRFRELGSPKDWVIFQACNLIHRFKQEVKHV